MTARGFLALLFVTVVAIAGAAGLIISEQVSANAEKSTGGPMFPALLDRSDELASLTIQSGGVATSAYRMVLEPRNDGWVDASRGDYPVRAERAEQILADFANLTAYEPKTANPDWYGEIAVNPPGPTSTSFQLTAKTASGEILADAIMGKPSSSIGFNARGGTFVRPADQAQAWLAEGLVSPPGYVAQWFDQIVHVPGTDVMSIGIYEGDKVVFQAHKSAQGSATYLLDYLDPAYGPPGSTAISDGVRSIPSGIVSTFFDDARAIGEVTFAPDARTVKFVTYSGLHLDVKIGTIDGEVWVTYAATGDAGTPGETQAAQITERTSRWTFKLPSYRNTALTTPVADLFTPPAAPPQSPVTDPRFLSGAPLVPGIGAPVETNPLAPVTPPGLPPGLITP